MSTVIAVYTKDVPSAVKCDECNSPSARHFTWSSSIQRAKGWCDDCAAVYVFHHTPLQCDGLTDLRRTQKFLDSGIEVPHCPTCRCCE